MTTSQPTADSTIKQRYSLWRFRIMVALILGYAFLYTTRTNLSFAILDIQKDLGYTKQQLGVAISVAGAIYGIGRFINGLIGDRCSPRLFFSVGIMLAALTNLCLSCTTNLTVITFLWGLNSYFQSMGAPACASMLTHWFSPNKIGTQWALWSTSQQMGYFALSLSLPLCVGLLGWRCAFWLPGLLTLIAAFAVYILARSEPTDAGLPELETFDDITPDIEDRYAHLSSFQVFYRHILRSRVVWAMCLACFFIYFVRFTYFNWGPVFLQEAKGCDPLYAGRLLAVFYVADAIGGVLAGVASDRLFKGHRGRVGFLFSAGLALGLFCVWHMPAGNPWLHLVAMFVAGFFLTGPLTMISVSAVGFASKKAAGTASGLTSIFGYIGVTLSGYGPARIAEVSRNWNDVFVYMTLAATAAAVCFLFTWNDRATYHKTQKESDDVTSLDQAA